MQWKHLGHDIKQFKKWILSSFPLCLLVCFFLLPFILSFSFSFWGTEPHYRSGWPRTCYVDQNSLEPSMILLSLPPKRQNFKKAVLYLVLNLFGLVYQNHQTLVVIVCGCLFVCLFLSSFGVFWFWFYFWNLRQGSRLAWNTLHISGRLQPQLPKHWD